MALTQEHIDKDVLHTLETKTLPSRAARAADAVMPAVVRVQGYNGEENDGPGSGVQMEGVGIPAQHQVSERDQRSQHAQYDRGGQQHDNADGNAGGDTEALRGIQPRLRDTRIL